MIEPYYTNLGRFASHRDREYYLEVLTPPDQEPITYDEVAAYCRVTTSQDFANVLSLAIAARQIVEEHTRLSLMQATYRVSYDGFFPKMRLPRRPVTDITSVSVSYLDPTGATQTLPTSAYSVDQKGIWTTVMPAPFTVFPQTQFVPNAVQITFTAGESTDLSTVNPMARLAIKAYAKFLYDNEIVAVPGSMEEVPLGLQTILSLLGAPEL